MINQKTIWTCEKCGYVSLKPIFNHPNERWDKCEGKAIKQVWVLKEDLLNFLDDLTYSKKPIVELKKELTKEDRVKL